MTFSDEPVGFEAQLKSSRDETYNITDNVEDDLGDFFSRPIKIAHYTWSVGGSINTVFEPWKLYLDNKRVVNRMSNYNLVRAKMCLKIMLNGNMFHYGKLMASYMPVPDYEVNFPLLTDDTLADPKNLIRYSQRPHIYLDASVSQGGCLELPFLWPYNNCRVVDGEARLLGKMVLQTINALKHANGGTDNISITVFASLADVELNIPTSINPSNIIPQAGEMEVNSSISQKLAAVSGFAGSMTKVPFIGTYARATQMAAGTGAAIAKLFGFSRPIIPHDIVPYKPVYVGDMSSTNNADTSVKLALDCKQELTIDPRVVGLSGDDEMAISNIVQKESYYETFTWGTTQVTDTHLYSIYLAPGYMKSAVVGSNTEFHLSSLAFAAQPFEYWRGGIKIRIQAVCSGFHQGRLRVVYDPNFPVASEYNLNFSAILDLEETRDITIEVPWCQDKTWLRTPSVLSVIPLSSTVQPNSILSFTNGTLSFFVLNELVTPNTVVNNDIGVNIFVSGSEDLEFSAPVEDRLGQLSYLPQPPLALDELPVREHNYVPQAGPMEPNTDESSPETPQEMQIIPLTPKIDHKNDVWFGDPIVSFRTLLKRYNYYVSYPADNTTTAYRYRLPNFPLQRGYAGTYKHMHNTLFPTDPTPYNFSKMTLLNYVSMSYLMRRGAMRWKYYGNGVYFGSHLRVDKLNGNQGLDRFSITLPANTQSSSQKAAFWELRTPDGASGMNVVPSSQNPVNEIEIPYYSNRRYEIARAFDSSGYQHHEVNVILQGDFNLSAKLDAYCAIGEDFSLYGYMGPAIIYYYFDPTPSTSEVGVFS